MANSTGASGMGAGEFDGSTSFDPDRRELLFEWDFGDGNDAIPHPAVGTLVTAFWPVDDSWYIGTVQQYNPATGEHLLNYGYGDTEWVQIGENNCRKFIFRDPSGFDINAYDYEIVRNLLVTYVGVSEECIENEFEEKYGSNFWGDQEGESIDVNLSEGECLGMRLDDENRRVVAITLEWVVNIDTILEQLKRLPHLTKLVLKSPEFESLPSCIGDFHNLKALQIHDGLIGRLERLPKEIGNLRNLEELRLRGTCVEALPEEIGKLTNLTRLVLYDTKRITSLPSPMPQNLEELILEGVEGLEELPSDIGTLTSLTTLNLAYSGIESLPDSSKSLTRLHYLILDEYTIEENPEFSVEALVQTYPSLVSFGEHGLHDEELNLALACRRARISIRRGLAASRMPHPTAPKAALWPYMLQYSAAPFNQYPPAELAELQDTDYSDNNGGYEMQGPDAIYQLLSNHQIVPRARIGLGWEALPKLWPYVLQQSTVPFNHYHPLDPHPECYKRRYDVQEQDAVYLLLSIHRGSFLGVLNCGDSSE